MKKYYYFLTVLVLLFVIPAGSTIARMHPDGFRVIEKPTGDDHPWGGEEITPILPEKSYSEPTIKINTGNIILDYFLNKYFTPYNIRRSDNYSTPVKSPVRQINISNTDINNTNTSNNRGSY